MSIERIFYCDRGDCERHVRTASSRAVTWLTVTEGTGRSHHFCSWDCAMLYAAQKPSTELVSAATDE